MFMPYAVVRHKAKKKTLEYYTVGAKQLSRSAIGRARINEISEYDVAGYIEEHESFSPSGINQALRTLRRALRLAFQWRKIQRIPVIKLCPNENMRDRVVSFEEEKRYLEAATEPWRTMAIIMIELGLRPGEVFRLKVEDIDLKGACLRVTSGKSQAVKRDLPMTAAVYDAVAGYLKRTGKRKSGWLFESPKFKGRHYSQKLAHDWHHAALKKAGLESFEPYCLRHTTLTRLAKHCRNPYAVAKAAGHSSIVMTYRYIHPEKEEI